MRAFPRRVGRAECCEQKRQDECARRHPEAEMRPGFSYLLDTTAKVPGLLPRAVTAHWPAVLYEIGPGFGRDPDCNDHARRG